MSHDGPCREDASSGPAAGEDPTQGEGSHRDPDGLTPAEDSRLGLGSMTGRRWTGCRPKPLPGGAAAATSQPLLVSRWPIASLISEWLIAAIRTNRTSERTISPQRRIRPSDSFRRLTRAESATGAEATIGDDPRAPLTRSGMMWVTWCDMSPTYGQVGRASSAARMQSAVHPQMYERESAARDHQP